MNPSKEIKNPVVSVIGFVDAYGAIHYRQVRLGDDSDDTSHCNFWPTNTHKRWRFYIQEWELHKSPLSDESITEEDADRIVCLMRKVCKPPEWFLEGEAWNQAGRPRDGEYDKFLRTYKKSKSKSLRTAEIKRKRKIKTSHR